MTVLEPMEQATGLRALLNRLRFLGRPLPLASLVGAVLLSIFVWDYLRHPEWFGAFEETAAGPNTDLDLSGLTPEEQAAVSDIDNLSLLFSELGIEAEARPEMRALPDPDAAEETNAFLTETLALSRPSTTGSTSGESPFTRYLEQYQFGGSGAIAGQNDASQRSAARNSSYFPQFNRGQQGRTTQRFNPLSAALDNQAGLGSVAETEETTPLSDELRSQSAGNGESTEGTTETASSQATQGNLPPGEFSSQTVTIPGVDFPVLPTLPQMSPPPGTTGYTPPATVDLMPPLPGSNRPNTPAFPATPLAPGSTGVPDLSAGTGLPSVGTSQVDVSNGYVTPYTPVTPSATTLPTTTPAPFTAPRPPGSYIGGGYINTFSNPGGPSN